MYRGQERSHPKQDPSNFRFSAQMLLKVHKCTILGDSCLINFVLIKYIKASGGFLFSVCSMEYLEQSCSFSCSSCWRVCRPVWTFVDSWSPFYNPQCGTFNAEALSWMLQWETLIKCRVGSSMHKAHSWCRFVTRRLSWCSVKASPQANDGFQTSLCLPLLANNGTTLLR